MLKRQVWCVPKTNLKHWYSLKFCHSQRPATCTVLRCSCSVQEHIRARSISRNPRVPFEAFAMEPRGEKSLVHTSSAFFLSTLTPFLGGRLSCCFKCYTNKERWWFKEEVSVCSFPGEKMLKKQFPRRDFLFGLCALRTEWSLRWCLSCTAAWIPNGSDDLCLRDLCPCNHRLLSKFHPR